MNCITRHTRYCPHLIDTRYNEVKLFRKWKDANAVCRRYHISRASLYRWNKRYDGTKKSLMDKSHRPNSAHPNAHSEEEIKWIKDYHRRNPDISVCELYGKLIREKNYKRRKRIRGRLSPHWNNPSANIISQSEELMHQDWQPE